jgi:chromosome segregation ATPase
MDEPKMRPGFPGDRSQAAAEKLRALRERANHALEEHRGRLGEIETQLSDRVRQLAEEYGASLGAAKGAEAEREDEIAALRRQVEEGQAKHDKFVEQLIAARQQLDDIQSQPCVSCQQAAQQLVAADEDLRRLREQLETSAREHEQDRVRHEKFVEQLTAARQAINVLQHAAGESTAELRGELETLRDAKIAGDEQLAAALSDQEALHGECDAALARAEAFEQELGAVRLELAEMREQAATLNRDRTVVVGETDQLRQQIAALGAKLAQAERDRDELGRMNLAADGDKESLAASLAAAQDALASLQAATQAEQGGLVEMLAAADADTQAAERKLAASESEKLTLSLSLSQAESVGHEYQNRLAAAQRELDELRAQAAAGAEAPELRTQLEKAQAAAAERAQVVGELKRTLEEARGELVSLRDSMVSKADLESARRDCQAAQSAIVELQAAVAAAQAEAAATQSMLTQAQAEVAAAGAETAAVREATRPAEEFTELQQKFDLALADVRKLKRECSGLREELAGRPEASDLESPELIAARSDRDVLSARVAELEAAAAAAVTIDVDAQQDRDDLQRRFEMAVDDVRQLKQENAQLREKVAAGAKGSADGAPTAGAGAGDWASQRARLMAMLEEEDGAGDIAPERTAERATVAKTIAATDRVIANKDQEIAELRTALETHGDGTVADHEAAALRDQVLDADEVVAAERQRLARLSAEWEEKLRSAELEFSIERAKLARDQAALRERVFELDSGAPPPASGEPVDTSKPRRRWLSALGIQEDEPKKK